MSHWIMQGLNTIIANAHVADLSNIVDSIRDTYNVSNILIRLCLILYV